MNGFFIVPCESHKYDVQTKPSIAWRGNAMNFKACILTLIVVIWYNSFAIFIQDRKMFNIQQW